MRCPTPRFGGRRRLLERGQDLVDGVVALLLRDGGDEKKAAVAKKKGDDAVDKILASLSRRQHPKRGVGADQRLKCLANRVRG